MPVYASAQRDTCMRACVRVCVVCLSVCECARARARACVRVHACVRARGCVRVCHRVCAAARTLGSVAISSHDVVDEPPRQPSATAAFPIR